MKITSVGSSKQLLNRFKTMRSIVADDTGFMAVAFLYLVEVLERIEDRLPRRKKHRPLSDWQIFLSRKLKEGASVKKAAEEWRKRL